MHTQFVCHWLSRYVLIANRWPWWWSNTYWWCCCAFSSPLQLTRKCQTCRNGRSFHACLWKWSQDHGKVDWSKQLEQRFSWESPLHSTFLVVGSVIQGVACIAMGLACHMQQTKCPAIGVSYVMDASWLWSFSGDKTSASTTLLGVWNSPLATKAAIPEKCY